jgi:Zn-dependent protease with chaperone function
MKKIIFVLFIVLLSSCANRTQYAIPQASQEVKERNATIINNYATAFNCLKIREDGKTSRLRLHPSGIVNTWVDENNDVFITQGLLAQGEDVVMFAIVHELAHIKLNHVRNKKIVSTATTGVLLVANVFVPGAALLNNVVNPAITNNFSKSQEYDADKLASETLARCLNMPLEKQIKVLESMKARSDGGGFWAAHPSWSDRIKNINH